MINARQRAALISVQRAVTSPGLPKVAELRRWAVAALGQTRGEITIRIVGEAEGAELNERYRHKAYATNVLSFGYDAEPLYEDSDDIELALGDLVVCAPVVAREAAEQGKTLEAHWAHMIVHGVLHLLGEDHEDEAEAERMEQHEREILASLGYPDPYRATP